jgi:hypothetical protein
VPKGGSEKDEDCVAGALLKGATGADGLPPKPPPPPPLPLELPKLDVSKPADGACAPNPVDPPNVAELLPNPPPVLGAEVPKEG